MLHRTDTVWCRRTVIAATVLLAATTLASAQVKAPSMFEAPYAMSSTPIDNLTNQTQMVWQHLVEIPYSDWLQLEFANYRLPGSSYVEIKSFKDGATQRLDRAMMQKWFPRSAYFNGDALMVRLFAGPQTRGVQLDLRATVVGLSPTGNDTICGPTDDRVNSNDARACRLLPIGCTAWIATANGLLLTAGHCLGRSNPIVQFNVPQSLPNGTIQHPPPQDQYTVAQELAGLANGTGCDWGIMLAGTNNQNQTPLQRQNAFFVLRTVPPTANATIRITGYGSASGTRNQTQKTHTGPFVTLGNGASCNGAYRLQYRTDTTGGNSGSPVIDDATNQAIGIHTHGGCTSSSGSNSGTFLANADFQRALSTLFVRFTHTPLGNTADVVNNYTVNSTIVSGGSNITAASLTYAVNGGAPTTIPLAKGTGDNYSASIPAQAAVATVSYSMRATDANSNAGSIGPFSFTVGRETVLLSDSFETNSGWTPDPGDNATTGRFERADPFASGQNQPENDNTPNGTICYITQNGFRGQTTSQHDVDNGKTSIISPTFDLSGVPLGAATLDFAYWLVILTQLNDFLQVDVSTTNGSSWNQIWRQTSTQSAWRKVSGLTIPGPYTNTMKIRLWVQDNPNNSLTDCCLDDIVIKTVDDNVAALTGNTATPSVGTTVNYTLQAQREPNAVYIYAYSLSNAKTTLVGIGTLDLGLPLVPLAIGALNGSGAGSFGIPIPNAPVLRGLTVYTQAVVSGGANIVSNLWTLKLQ